MKLAPDAYIAFEAERRVGAGSLRDVACAARATLDRRQDAAILIFDSHTGSVVDIDLRGSIGDVLARIPPTEGPEAREDIATAPRGPGRPKLGVVAREVTLLPRHWDWLAQQKGGASVAIRRLVEEARRANEDKDRVRLAQEAAYRFISTMAGNRPHFEEAIRALFAYDSGRFEKLIAEWPADIRDHAAALAARAFSREP